MIKMVVTDLDGTLLRDDKTVSEHTVEVLSKLKTRGILLIVATARPVRAVKNLLPNINFDAGVYHNGAVIVGNAGEYMGIGIKNPRELVMRILSEKPDCHITVEANDQPYANFNASNIWPGMEYIETSDFKEIEGSEADKLIVESRSIEELTGFKRFLPEDLYIQLSENRIGMIMNKSATKLNAIGMLTKAYNIAFEDIAAFGDDYNDVELIKNCGCGIAVGNALEDVKAVAKYVCGTNMEDGVAFWLEKTLCI